MILTSSTTWAQSFKYINDCPESIERDPIINVQSNKEGTYDSITLKFKPYISRDPYAISVGNGSLTVNGDTIAEVNAVMKEDQTSPGKNEGIYVLYANGNQASKIDLNGNVNIVLKQDDPNVPFKNVGLNVIYAKNSGVISIGNENSTTRIWTISSQPDVISAKDGGKVTIQSTHNQIVGNVDTMAETNFVAKVSISGYNKELTKELTEPGIQSTVETTFSGTSSYWLGDEKSWNNVGGLEITQISIPWEISQVESSIESSSSNKIDFTFENGAQWIYLGLKNSYERTESISYSGITVTVTGNINQTVKRISSITLQNGGIVNLY